MNEEYFELLRSISNDSFREAAYGGLRTMLASDPNFSKYSEKNYRLKAYQTEHEFYLTHHEKNIHLIGFIDALVYLSRAGYLNLNPHDGEYSEYLDEDDAETDIDVIEEQIQDLEAINACIIYIETGEVI